MGLTTTVGRVLPDGQSFIKGNILKISYDNHRSITGRSIEHQICILKRQDANFLITWPLKSTCNVDTKI